MNTPTPQVQDSNLYITLPSGETFLRKTYSQYTKEELINIIKQCNNIRHILNILKLNKIYHYKIKEFIHNNNISTEHFKKIYIYTEYNNKTINTNCTIKKKLLNNGELINKCAICNMEPIWNNKPITLQLDHINGINTDNNLENLRLLCPNCHSQTDTYTGRNVYKNNQTNTDNNKTNVIIYPEIIQQEKKYSLLTCNTCNTQITKKSKTGICQSCHKKNTRIVERPSYETLLNDIQELGYVQTGKKYGVSDNSIRKWVKNYSKESKKK